MRRRRNGSAVEMQTITGEETYSLLKLASFRVLESKLKFLEVESNLVLLFLTKPFNLQVS